MRDSGITFSPLAGTVMVWLAETDPRSVMKEIMAEQGGNWLLFQVKVSWPLGIS